MMHPEQRDNFPRKNSFSKKDGLLVVFSVAISLMFCELILRAMSPIGFTNLNYPIITSRNELMTSQPQMFDPKLGYVYKKGFYHPAHPNFGNKLFSTYASGIRSNLHDDYDQLKLIGFAEPLFDLKSAIIVTGDSFVAGSEVGNSETWPAKLEKSIGVRVLNGGVGGYSFTQAVLMGERLSKETGVQHLIVSLIPDDLIRSEHSIYQGVPRPYFLEANDQLFLETQHIQEFSKYSRETLSKEYEVLERYRWSYLIMEVLRRTHVDPNFFYYFGIHKNAGIRFDRVGCELVSRLEHFSEENGINSAILIQYTDRHFWDAANEQNVYIQDHIREFKNCVLDSKLMLIDMEGTLGHVYQNQPDYFENLFVGKGRHMSAIGNSFVADYVARAIKPWQAM